MPDSATYRNLTGRKGTEIAVEQGLVAFTEWTEAGKLRHPRFLGLTTDKKPSEVVRE
jgi:hypothetical protein